MDLYQTLDRKSSFQKGAKRWVPQARNRETPGTQDEVYFNYAAEKLSRKLPF